MKRINWLQVFKMNDKEMLFWTYLNFRNFKNIYGNAIRVNSAHYLASQVALEMKSTPMQETEEMWVRSLSREDPLGEGMATQSSILAWRIPWTEEPGGLQSMGSQRVGQN